MTIAHPMRKLTLTLALVALVAPAAALAQAHVSIQVGLPVSLPPLVVVEPGVRVVQDLGEEVFFVDGFYWARRGDCWYRARDHRARFTYAEPRWVPATLFRIPPGQYRHWHGEYRRPYGYQERGRPHWYPEHRHPRWHQVYGHPSWHQEHGRAEQRGWREARREQASDRGNGHGRGHRSNGWRG